MIQNQQIIQKDTISVVKKDEEVQPHITGPYLLCFFLYFLQGNVQSIGTTMPYLYPKLPNYSTLAVFNMVDFPFSLKFIVSPFLEKYTHFNYGKRKTWIIISQLACFCALLLGSHYTDVAEAHLFALILMLTVFMITVQDISLDSLAVKQIRCPEKASVVQAVANSFGMVVGSLLLLKLTSPDFAIKIGLEEAVTSPSVLIKCIAGVLVLTCLGMHLKFKETELDCQRRGKEKKLCQIISYTKTFFDLKSRYCRMGIFLLIYYQGFNFYEAGYDYEMVRAGFSRDNSNTISNLIAIVVIVLTFRIADHISVAGVTKSLQIIFGCMCAIYLFNLLVFSQNPYVFTMSQLVVQTLVASKNISIYFLVYQFPTHSFTGMFLTFLLSIWNLGELKTLHTLLISRLGWRVCGLIGIGIQLTILGFLGKLLSWVEAGVVDIDQSILQKPFSQIEPEQSASLATTFARQTSEGSFN